MSTLYHGQISRSRPLVQMPADYVGEVILVAVNYDKTRKNHTCHIEKITKTQGAVKEQSRSTQGAVKEYSRSSQGVHPEPEAENDTRLLHSATDIGRDSLPHASIRQILPQAQTHRFNVGHPSADDRTRFPHQPHAAIRGTGRLKEQE